MRNNESDHTMKVRTLKKVRRHFINRTQNEEHDETIIDPPAYCISGAGVYAIKASVGLVEYGRKICIGPQYLNIHFNIKDAIVHNSPQSKTVTLNLCTNENNPPIPWEYTAKRLESYGDLQLAAWAQRIRKHYSKYSQVMANYYDQLQSNDPQTLETILKIRTKAKNACRELENNYSYNKIVQFLKKDMNELISSSYSSGFLNKIGHTPESFISWAKKNGLPKLLDTDSSLYENIIKEFLNCIPMIADSVQEGIEAESDIYNKEGCQLTVRAKCVTVLEPTPEGIFYYYYLIVKDTESDKTEKTLRQDEEDLNIYSKKIIKVGESTDSI